MAGVGRTLAFGSDVAWPVHGLRHPPEGDTSGWFIWTGDLGEAEDFFVPLHPVHLAARVPGLLEQLGAPPGTRFLLTPGHLDRWFDESLLDVE